MRRLLWATALGGAVTIVLALTADLPATLGALARFQWTLAPVVAAAVLANYALRFVKWHFYLHRLSIPLPCRQSLLVFLAGFTMSITPGKVGELLKAALVRDLIGESLSRVASVVMAERLTDVAGLLLLSALGATALPHGGLLLAAVAGLLVLAIGVLRTRWLADWLHARLLDGGRLSRLAEPLRVFLGAGRTLVAPVTLAWAILLSVVSWFFELSLIHI